MVSQFITLRLLQKPRVTQRLLFAQDEFGDDINFTIQDKDGNVVDLTGKTPALQVWSKGLKAFIDKDLTITNAVLGQCKYTTQQSDLTNRTGTFYAKVVLKTGTTKKEPSETFVLVVQE